MLSWDVIAETLLEDDYEDDGDGPAAAHLVSFLALPPTRNDK